jgi:hypothetical protein
MRLQVSDPSDHPLIGTMPFADDLTDWDLPHIKGVLGLHRHVVRLVELGEPPNRLSYVVKELPDHLAQREYRLLRRLADEGLPTIDVVAVVTDRTNERDGLLVTRHLDYSLPYRTLLSGRVLTISSLGDRMLDALVGLLVRLHLAGFFWGDCSLSNVLFRRDAGALQAYVIDVETSEMHPNLTDGQRQFDLDIATENVTGGLLDLEMAGRLVAAIDPWDVGDVIESRYRELWAELTDIEEFDRDEMWRIEKRIERLHNLGFDVEEMEVVIDGSDEAFGSQRLRFVPRVVEHGYHAERLRSLTGLRAGENQARRLINDIKAYGTELASRTGRPVADNVAAVRWLDQRFEPTIAAIPPQLLSKLQNAEIFHQLLEHRWFLSEQRGRDVSMEEALEVYIDDVLGPAPSELVRLDQPTAELFLPGLSDSPPDPA